MRIAFITFEYPPFIQGGSGIHAIHITQELARLGHEIVVFTPSICVSNSKINKENIEVILVPINVKIPFKAFQFWLQLPKEVKRIEKMRKFDIIHFNGISYWFLKKRIAHAPHIVTIHHLVIDALNSNTDNFFSRLINISGETGLLMPWIEKRCIQCADKIITVSKFTRDQIIRTYNVNKSNLIIIHNGIDERGYIFSEHEIDEIKLKYNIKNKPTLLFVGRIDDPRKGLDMLIKAFKFVLVYIDAQLIIVGNGKKEKIMELAGPIAHYLFFLGYVDDITLKKCYSLCDVYICPSRLEGFGLTILEAFAAGKPVIATNTGAIPELIQNGINGILIEKDDINEMSKAIIYYLKNPKLCKDIGEINTHYAKKNKWVESVKKLEKVYYYQK